MIKKFLLSMTDHIHSFDNLIFAMFIKSYACFNSFIFSLDILNLISGDIGDKLSSFIIFIC